MMRPPVMLLVLLLGTAGCTETYPAYPVAPAPRAERVPAPPPAAEALSWRPGHYDWSGSDYVWVSGDWVPLAGHSAMWQDGYWRRTGERSYEWIAAGWK